MTENIEKLNKHVIEGKYLMQKWSEGALIKEKPINFGDVLITVKAKDAKGWQEE